MCTFDKRTILFQRKAKDKLKFVSYFQNLIVKYAPFKILLSNN